MAEITIDNVKPGERREVQLAPPGQYPQLIDDKNAEGGKKRIIQNVDAEAIARLVKNFDGDVLVDADHNSENGGSTEARAWVKELKVDPKLGLVGVFEFTDKGADDVTNKRYRFISPAWTMGDDGRPLKLVSVGFTNKPNLPVAPILNMRMCNAMADTGAVSPDVKPEDGQAAGAATGNPPPAEGENEKGPEMEKVKEILGLPPEATEDDIATAVQALADKVGDMESAMNEAEAEDFAEENKDAVEDPEVLKNCYLRDPEMAKVMVANAKKAAKPVVTNAAPAAKPVVNAQTAVEPQAPVAPVVVTNSLMDGFKACKTIEEQNAYIAKNAAAMVQAVVTNAK